MYYKKMLCVLCCCSMLGMTGCSSGVDIASITKGAVKDVAMDEAKSMALGSLTGGSSDSSISNLIKSSKYTGVTASKQKLTKRFGSKYYFEGYRYDNAVYLGDRRNNKPDNLNFSMSAGSEGLTDFTIATYKKGSPDRDTFISFDMDNATLVMGELKNGKLVGDYIVYDAYYSTVTYKSGDKVKDTFENDDVEFSFDSLTGELSYVSDTCNFKGTPFKFTCAYDYAEDKVATFDFITLIGVVLNSSDGTYGEMVNSVTAGIQSVSDCLVDLGLKTFTKVCVDAAKAGVPALEVIDTGLEVTTGGSLEDRLNSVLSEKANQIKEEGLVGTINSTLDDLDQWAKDKEEEKREEERKKKEAELDEKMQSAVDRGWLTFGDKDDTEEVVSEPIKAEDLLGMDSETFDAIPYDMVILPDGVSDFVTTMSIDGLVYGIEFLDEFGDVLYTIGFED